MHEVEITRRFQQRALNDSRVLSFVGAGAYHHHIPSPVSLASNPFTSIVGEEILTGAQQSSSLAESLSGLNAMEATHCAGSDLIAAAVQGIGIIQNSLANSQSIRIIIASTVNPFYRKAIRTWFKHAGIDPAIVHYDQTKGAVGLAQLKNYDTKTADVLIIQYPNFFGVTEEVDKISDWAYAQGIPLIAIVNPLALGTLKPPGSWGKHGADMAIYDLQTLGLPVYLSGSVPGFLSINQGLIDKLTPATKSSLDTLDAQQADNWMLARANAYLTYLGSIGLGQIALHCQHNLQSLESSLLENPSLSVQFVSPRFHECVIKFDRIDLPAVLSLCARHGFQIGYSLETEYPELGQCVLFNATEVHIPEDIDAMVAKLSKVVEIQSKAACPVAPKF
jgi:glycine dehydrogenase subunit 1